MARKSIESKYVKMLQAGDMKAFEYIYNFYRESVYFFALSFLKNIDDAEDAVQETFIQVINSIHSLQKIDSFHSWLHKIAYNKSMLLHNKRKRIISVSENYEIEDHIIASENQVDSFRKQELVEFISGEMKKMPTKLVSVAQLYYFNHLNVKEISKILEIPEGTVKTRLKTIRDQIQPILKRKEFTPAMYFSFAFTPLLFKVFQTLLQNNPMSLNRATEIYQNIANEPAASASIAVGSGVAAGIGGFTGKTMITVAIITSGGYGAYRTFTPVDASEIKEIRYHDKLTNKDVEVEALAKTDIIANDVSVTSQGNVLEFQLEANYIRFVVGENATYEITIKGETKSFEITNIDKSAPELLDAIYKGEKLTLSLNDDLAGIDFEKSRAEYFGETFAISKKGIISGRFEGEVRIIIFDLVGNTTEYTIEIK